MGKSRIESYAKALQANGVPKELAVKCAQILDKDDPSKPNLGRTQEDQILINQANQFAAK